MVFYSLMSHKLRKKTDLGIIVNHGDHKHFFFYSDLKNTKWAYLIPENYQEKIILLNLREVNYRQARNRSKMNTFLILKILSQRMPMAILFGMGIIITIF